MLCRESGRAGQTVPMPRSLLPGLVVVALVATASLVVAANVTGVSALIVAIVLGVVVRNVGLLRPAVARGVAWSARHLLRAGVVLLGLQLSVPAVLELGTGGLVVIVVTVAVTFSATLVMGRVLRVPQVMTLLVATGFAICGAAAVAAMSAVVDPDGEHEDDTATAIALVTLFGSVALVVLPMLVPLLGFGERAAGLWIGASVHEVAQVIAAGEAVSAVALTAATVTKLGRVVLLAPLVAGTGVALRVAVPTRRADLPPAQGADLPLAQRADRPPAQGADLPRAHRAGRTAAHTADRPPVLPLFVGGFLVAVLVRSTGLLPGGVLDAAQLVTTTLLTGAMFGLGTGVHLHALVRTGGRATALGAASTVVAVTVAGGLVTLVG